MDTPRVREHGRGYAKGKALERYGCGSGTWAHEHAHGLQGGHDVGMDTGTHECVDTGSGAARVHANGYSYGASAEIPASMSSASLSVLPRKVLLQSLTFRKEVTRI